MISGKFLEMKNLKEFSYGHLKVATKNFKSDALLGEGGFRKVYRGWLNSETLTPTKAGIGMMVAIEKLNSHSLQGVQEWQSEINFLGRISHPNLVKLLGYCKVLLVYEFMRKGSLESHLFKSMNLETTKKKWSNDDCVIIFNRSFVCEERCIWIFGVVLLEMLTGLQELDRKWPTKKQNIVEWIKSSLSDERKLKGNIVDYRLEGQYSPKAAFEIAWFILKCLEYDPRKRPSMENVLETLEGMNAIKHNKKISKNH